MKKKLIVISCILALVMCMSIALTACSGNKVNEDDMLTVLSKLRGDYNNKTIANGNTLPGSMETSDAKGNDMVVYIKWKVNDTSTITIKKANDEGRCAVVFEGQVPATVSITATLVNEKDKAYTDAAGQAYSVTLTMTTGTSSNNNNNNNNSGSGETDTVTFVMQDQGFTDKSPIGKNISKDGITIAFSIGTGKTEPSYYTNNGGNAVRLYGGNTMTISGKTIVNVELTLATEYDSNEITVNTGTLTMPTWTGSTDSLVFTIGGTSGNRRITQIVVTYEK